MCDEGKAWSRSPQEGQATLPKGQGDSAEAHSLLPQVYGVQQVSMELPEGKRHVQHFWVPPALVGWSTRKGLSQYHLTE